MTVEAIHQFHSGAASGDAITDQMFSLQRLLRQAGFASNVYGEHIAADVADRVISIGSFKNQESSLLLVHHSMGYTAFPLIKRLRLPKITIFHSITPAVFFDDPFMQEKILEGFAQLRELAALSVAGIADSNHNRKQMYDAGFESVAVMPVKTDYSTFRSLQRVIDPSRRDWLFVGRLVPNKRQRELVTAFAHYRRTYGDGHLHLVGDASFEPYVASLRTEIELHGLRRHVTIHGKVSSADLRARYQAAAVFVCVSLHEGFGVPLLEAMAAGLPVVALDAAAVSETMGGAGALLKVDDAATTAATVRVILEDDEMRSRLIAEQDRRLELIERFDSLGVLTDVIRRAELKDSGRRPTLQIQGPFETSYSLAILNRELALELSKRDFDVSIYATEGPGDYVPDPKDLRRHPEASRLFAKAAMAPFPDIAVRQMYPPRVDDSPAGMTFQYFGWEESRVPEAFVQDFNRHLDGIGVMSGYVRDVLRDEGVAVPIAVVGVGVHPPDPQARVVHGGIRPSTKFTFVHISSAFPRKGVDVLLRAYFESFGVDDEVRLILKTFPNPHNQVETILAALRVEFPGHPEVVWVDTDLDRSQLDGLYAIADSYVHPARGEGFGLPVAEAMLAGVPVISTAAGGLADFVNAATAAVVSHELKPANTHLTLHGSLWAEPDLESLKVEMRRATSGADDVERKKRVEVARRLITDEFSWSKVADRWQAFIQEERKVRGGIRIAAVTTFNSRCGIAEYSASLYSAMDGWAQVSFFADRDAEAIEPTREFNVERVWQNHRSAGVDDLLEALAASPADITHIQYNFGFFTLKDLAKILRQEAERRPTILTLHRTAALVLGGRTEALADIADDLRRCDALIVHQEADRRRLAEAGVEANVHVLPIGSGRRANSADVSAGRIRRRNASPHTFVVGTYGFMLPHKGLLHLLEAVDILRARDLDVGLVACCAIHPDASSPALLEEVRAEIQSRDLRGAVQLHTSYLEHDDSLALLEEADVIVLPYAPTAESSSAAIRSILPLNRPIVTSDISIFEDVRGCVRQVPSPISPVALADELETLLLDAAEQERLAAAVRRYVRSTSWDVVGRRTRELYGAALSGGRPRSLPGTSHDTTSKRTWRSWSERLSTHQT